MKIAYQAVIEEDEHGFFVQFPDLAEAHTDGETMAEALFNAEEVLNLTLEDRMEEGMDIPEAQEHEGGVWIYPAAQIQAALLIRRARALETSWPSARQLENPVCSFYRNARQAICVRRGGCLPSEWVGGIVGIRTN